jgi:hypothetical protein
LIVTIAAPMCATSTVTGIEHVTTKNHRYEQAGQAILPVLTLPSVINSTLFQRELLP